MASNGESSTETTGTVGDTGDNDHAAESTLSMEEKLARMLQRIAELEQQTRESQPQQAAVQFGTKRERS